MIILVRMEEFVARWMVWPIARALVDSKVIHVLKLIYAALTNVKTEGLATKTMDRALVHADSKARLVQRLIFAALTNAKTEELATPLTAHVIVHVASRETPVRKWTSAAQTRV